MKTAVISATLLLSVTSVHAAGTALDTATQALAAGKWNKSVFWSQKALHGAGLSTGETIQALTALCVGQIKLGRFAEAAETCDKAVVVGPAEWTGYLNRGNLRALTGDSLGARADYARARDLNPAHPVTQAAASAKTIAPSMLTASFIGLGAGGPSIAQTATSIKGAAGEQ